MPDDTPQHGSAGAAIPATRRYHEATNHLTDPTGLEAHYARSMNEAIRPRLHKLYPELAPIPLPRDHAPSPIPALDAIADATGAGSPGEPVPDVAAIARLLLLSDGITRRIRRGDRVIDFRAAPCTGALYHVELYLVCGSLPGLDAGVYHYGVHDHALRLLRPGDFRSFLVEVSGNHEALAHAPAVMVTTSVYWRNAWKYLERAYRHTYWDTGTMLPNTLAVAAASGLPAHLVLSFADPLVATLLDVDLDDEGVISMVALGRSTALPPSAPAVEPLDLPIEPYSPRELDLPLIRETHQATLLDDGTGAARWRSSNSAAARISPPGQPLIELPAPETQPVPQSPIEDVIRRRGSSRAFAREPITLGKLSTLLDRTTRGIPSDVFGSDGVPFNSAYLIVNAVTGLSPGAYAYHRERHALEPLDQLSEADARERSAYLALQQDLGGEAAVNIYFLVDLDSTLERFGERGYRLAQLDGSLVAGKIYLAAYALGFGATGLTFYDDAVIDFFSPHAIGKSVMFLVALGVPARRN